MKIALIGATGYVGSKLLPEALSRGHQITAIAKHLETLPQHDQLTSLRVDVTDTQALSECLAGQDVVISAFNPGSDPDGRGVRALLAGVKQAGVARFLSVGGAGSLHLPSGERVIDQPDFPAEWKAGALLTIAFLDLLRTENELDWVFLSPSALLVPGERTGKYRVGTDNLLIDADGKSHISLEDYAVAMLDEAERPQHHRERFTVGY
ncbi:NAD(P)-dependent oxidoreductase [Parachitinimonas caeni]|uniref:NAD(P)-dependent oxidoreductase n=1 Tax=Parachitinimonas caeni TaxID=3031301 RepID=A0ABT7E1R2_9NEIS|nr:NAD(P)-dependent oxidoreductase [Parachitinimonas caeni]MDK2124842.1 NAD(P)-dependent oxidoreductase [Parachitinimonas caeni]